MYSVLFLRYEAWEQPGLAKPFLGQLVLLCTVGDASYPIMLLSCSAQENSNGKG